MHDHDLPYEFANEAQAHVAAIAAGWQSSEDPELCGCRGDGWILSEVDTWVRCPIHGAGAPHPDEDELRAEVARWERQSAEGDLALRHLADAICAAIEEMGVEFGKQLRALQSKFFCEKFDNEECPF